MDDIEELGKLISAFRHGSEVAWPEDLHLAQYILEAGYLLVEPIELEVLSPEVISKQQLYRRRDRE